MNPEPDYPDLGNDTVVERINKEDLVPLYYTDHIHTYETDPTDTSDSFRAEICSVEGCNLGRLIRK